MQSGKKHKWQVESLALFKLGNGTRISFWHDSWLDFSTLGSHFAMFLRIAMQLLSLGISL